jgi:hypothetical protein
MNGYGTIVRSIERRVSDVAPPAWTGQVKSHAMPSGTQHLANIFQSDKAEVNA